jgi:DNA-binding MarR family transcriptional regulator
MDRIEDCISFLLGKATQRVSRRAKELLAEHEVTPVQYAVLCVLWERDGQVGSDLSARLVIDSATMTGVIDRLQRGGLIARRPDPDDRRSHRLHLTDRGRSLRAPLDAAMAQLNREVAELLGPDEAMFRGMLRELAQAH